MPEDEGAGQDEAVYDRFDSRHKGLRSLKPVFVHQPMDEGGQSQVNER